MQTTFLAHVTGNPNITTLASVNVRAQPGTGTNVAVLFQAPIGTQGLAVLDVQPDQDQRAYNSKVYQWFRLQFANGEVGWVRDDLLTIDGDGTRYGYPKVSQAAYAFSLVRQLLPNVAPAPVPTPPPPTPTPPPSPSPIPTPPTDVTGTVISNNGLNLRDAPVNGNIKARLAYRSTLKIVAAQTQSGTAYHWAQVQTSQGTGWVRSDFLSISGDGSRFGLSKGDEYPMALHNYWYVRGQNDVQANGSIDKHNGWDFGANAGEPIFCGPRGGTVANTYTCTRCTADKPNVLSQGIALNDPRVLNDPAWGFGYGNAVMVRYLNSQLPASSRDRLTARNLAGAHLFVIYGHMSVTLVQKGQALSPSAQIGVIGNTGNSTATHLHVEVRASANPADLNWASMPEFDPEILFLR